MARYLFLMRRATEVFRLFGAFQNVIIIIIIIIITYSFIHSIAVAAWPCADRVHVPE